MKLNEFLKLNNLSENNIITYSGKKALEAVKQDGYALQYVKDQTQDICIEAVKQDGYALRYVDKSIFDNEDIIVIDGKKYSESTIKLALQEYVK